VLLVTGKATRFSPNQQLLHDYMSSLSENKENSHEGESNTKNDEGRSKHPRKEMPELDDSHKMVWVKDGDRMHPLVIEVGIDDGSNIEVRSGLEEGTVLVTSFELADGSEVAVTSHKDEDQKSPFVQERPKRKAGQGGGPR